MKTQTNSRVQGGEYLTHRRSLIATVAVVLATLAGCATPLDARRDAEYQAKASVMDRPVVRPVRSISSFSESLLCMDHMLRAAELPTTLIASKQLPDYSGKVPAATKEMIITSLSQMSRLSNAFRYVDYEVDIARQDTVQNLTTILLNNNQMQLQRPALYVSGAVAFVDQGVISNNLALGTAASRLDTGYSRSRNATIIALEMHLGDFRTRTLIPGMDSANEVIVGGAGEGLDLAGRIGNYGVKFNVGRDYALGTGGALRTLVLHQRPGNASFLAQEILATRSVHDIHASAGQAEKQLSDKRVAHDQPRPAAVAFESVECVPADNARGVQKVGATLKAPQQGVDIRLADHEPSEHHEMRYG